MKKVISIALSLVLAVGLLSLPSASAAALANAKITDELSAAITKDGSAKAFVTMNDVDHAKVMKTFMTEYPAEFEAYTQAKFDVAASSGIEITDELVQSAVERKREIYREYYTAANQAVISACVASKNVTFVSAYSPIAIVEVNRTEALQLAKNVEVLQLDLIPVEKEASRLINIGTTYYTYEDAVSELTASNGLMHITEIRDIYGLTGSGVNVGILEAKGIPDVNNPYLMDTTIYIRPGDVVEHDHATFIAIEIAGCSGTENYGAAPDAILYCSRINPYNTADRYAATEWLINQGVNVINASIGTGYSGSYTDVDKWFDHIAVMHDIHLVVSSGNTQVGEIANTYDSHVHSPGMAYNAITVGGYDMVNTGNTRKTMLTISIGSCHLEADPSMAFPRAEKPNLIANFYFNRPPSTYTVPHEPEGGLWGTSFAAPQVAGVIAQLCSYNAQLKFKQTAMGAILMASAARKVEAEELELRGGTFDSDVRVETNPQVSDKEGAGILNAFWARGIVARGNYWSPTVYSAGFPYTRQVTIDASSDTLSRIVIFWLARNSVSDHTSGMVTTTPVANLNLYVYDPNGDLVDESELTYANFEIVQFVPQLTGTYTIEITGTSTEKEYIGIALW